VPLIVGGAVAMVFAFTSLDKDMATAILYFACGSLVGLGLGELLGTALDRDARRVIPRRARRGWRLGLGIVLLLFAASCFFVSIVGALVVHPDEFPFVNFSKYVSGLTGITVEGSPTCKGSSLRVLTQRPEPDLTSVVLHPEASGQLPTEQRVVHNLTQRWCRSEAGKNLQLSAVFLATAVGLVTVVVITWRRRRRRRAVASATHPLSAPRPDRSSAPATSGRIT
jgi:hypothetical protein